MRLGGPVFDTANDPKSLVEYHQKYGFSAAYMGRIDDKIKRDELCFAYAEANIMLAEYGAYGINILETNMRFARRTSKKFANGWRMPMRLAYAAV